MRQFAPYRLLCCCRRAVSLVGVDIDGGMSIFSEIFSSPLPRLIVVHPLQRYLDIGGCYPVWWCFACGIDQLRNRMLNWDNSEEASQVAYVFQRLLQSEQGPSMLAQYNSSTGRTTLSSFTRMLSNQQDGNYELGWSPDTVAGVFYMMSVATQQPDFDPASIQEDRWIVLIVEHLVSSDDLARQWSLLLLATIWSHDQIVTVDHLKRILDLLVERVADNNEQTRFAALYCLWQYFLSDAYTRADTSLRGLVLRAAARVFATTQTDASILVRRLLLVCVETIQEKRPYWLSLSPWCYMATRVKDEGGPALEKECALLLQCCLRCCDECDTVEMSAERLAALEAICNAITRLCDDPDTRLASLAREVFNKANTSARDSAIAQCLPLLRQRLEDIEDVIDDMDPSSDAKTSSALSNSTFRGKGVETEQHANVYSRLLIAVRNVVHQHYPKGRCPSYVTEELVEQINGWRHCMDLYFHSSRLIVCSILSLQLEPNAERSCEQWTEKKLSRKELQAAEKVRRGKHTGPFALGQYARLAGF
jgi:hypothetical protein